MPLHLITSIKTDEFSISLRSPCICNFLRRHLFKSSFWLQKPIPAHRVVNRNGMLSGKMHFSSPTAMEDALKKEGVVVKKDCIVDFKKLIWDPVIELKL